MYKHSLPFYLLFLFLPACGGGSSDSSSASTDNTNANSATSTTTTGVTDEAQLLAEKINEYRIAQGLTAIPVSNSMKKVAEAHVNDLENTPLSEGCNLHSWSDQGNWSYCCYTADHAQAQCMWDKPREITNNLYQGNGYEIAAVYSGQMTATQALQQWQTSTGHNEVITNQGIWNNHQWQSMGVALSAHHAVVWFGEDVDPDGTL